MNRESTYHGKEIRSFKWKCECSFCIVFLYYLVWCQSPLESLPGPEDGHKQLDSSAAAAWSRGCTDISLRKKKKSSSINRNYGEKIPLKNETCAMDQYFYSNSALDLTLPDFCLSNISLAVVYWQLPVIPRELGQSGANSLWQLALYDRSSWPDTCQWIQKLLLRHE